MKITVTLKDPDTLHDAALDAAKDTLAAVAGIDDDEREKLIKDRASRVSSTISEKWMKWGEYLTVEFDLDTMTATVKENQ